MYFKCVPKYRCIFIGRVFFFFSFDSVGSQIAKTLPLSYDSGRNEKNNLFINYDFWGWDISGVVEVRESGLLDFEIRKRTLIVNPDSKFW